MKEITCLHCGEKAMRYGSTPKFCLPCSDWGKRHPLAGLASSLVAEAVADGKLPKVTTLTCVDCGVPATDYDHRDYTKPLDVDATCRSCNLMRGAAHPYKDEPNAIHRAARRMTKLHKAIPVKITVKKTCCPLCAGEIVIDGRNRTCIEGHDLNNIEFHEDTMMMLRPVINYQRQLARAQGGQKETS